MFPLALVVLHFTRLQLSHAMCTGNISFLELDGLEVLLNTTQGFNWLWNLNLPSSTRWSFPSDVSAPCTMNWQGLNCSALESGYCALCSLSLPGFNLQGSLPFQIGQFSAITYLNLSSNLLTGSIPVELGDMSSLFYLDLSSNLLLGSIPTLNQPSLKELHLNNNKLHGPIDTVFSQLLSLQVLDLSVNRLSGSIPTELSLLSACQILTVTDNNFAGTLPSTLFQSMVSLIKVVLDLNRLSGTLPLDNVSNLSQLEILTIASNYFSGPILPIISRISNIKQLELQDNDFTGSIPTEIGQLQHILELGLNSNNITGTLPTELGQLSSLSELYLYTNKLVGHIPTEIGLLASLTGLGLNENRLSGSLPTEIGLLSSVTFISLSNNSLVGPIASEIGKLSSLSILALYDNFFSGTVPTELGQLLALTQLGLYGNRLFGTIPTELSQLLALNDLYLYDNSLFGSIPTELGQLAALSQLYLYGNSITGPIPSELGQLKQLTHLALNRNLLEGSIPSEIGQMASLSLLYLYDNSLTGLLPTELGSLGSSLSVAWLYSNSLSGPIPIELMSLTSVEQLYIDANRLTGCLSSGISQLGVLQNLNLGSNFFSCQIPHQLFTTMPALQNLNLKDNVFSGSLPLVLNISSRLTSVEISLNMLTGSIPLLSKTLQSVNASFNLFSGNLDLLLSRDGDSDALLLLGYLDVSHNLLSGSLPSQWPDLFLPKLKTLLLSSNCFTGTISSTFTHIPRLENLLLDAYGSAAGCDVQVPHWLHWLIKGLFPRHATAVGTLPSEIVQLKTLQTLHSAGNALTGSLPDLDPDSQLIDVSLSNNYLHGTIPLSWQSRGTFVQLDLSDNKLSGVLSANLSVLESSNSRISLGNGSSVNPVFDLSVNRLSGQIPSSLHTARGVNILQGNLFQCQQNDIPQHDPNSDTYVCGSDDLNVSFYAWVVVAFVATGALAFLRFHSQSISPIDMKCCMNTNLFLETLQKFSRICIFLSICCVIVLLTAYISMKASGLSGYSTHTYQYGWVTTVAYFHGVPPAVIPVSCVIIACTFMHLLLQQMIPTPSTSQSTSPAIAAEWQGVMVIKLVVVVTCHVAVTVAVNAFYVFAVLAGLPTSKLTAVQFALGCFKLLWNSWYISWSMKRLQFLSPSGGLQLTSAMKIFTFLVSPYVATFFSDSSCFRYVITGAPVVSASFSARTFGCTNGCNGYNCYSQCGFLSISSIATSTSPPWLYSYQCSSALLTNYVPVLAASYLMSGLVVPLIVYVYLLLSQKLIETWVPIYVREYALSGTILSYKKDEGASPFNGDDSLAKELIAPSHYLSRPLFRCHQVMSKMVMNIAVLLTFGFATPILSVIIAVDTFNTWYIWRAMIQRYLLIHSTPEGAGVASSDAEQKLEMATVSTCSGLFYSWLFSLISVAFFWGLLVFDIVGDLYGPNLGGISTMVVSLSLLASSLVVLVSRAFTRLDRGVLSSKGQQSQQIENIDAIEMNSGFT